MSTFYETPTRSDELYHWKYTRRYRGPSGDWVYVYDDGSSSDRYVSRSTTSSTDAYGNTTRNVQRVVTNPDRWFSKKYTSENTKTNTTVKDGQTKTTTTHTKTETVERGKFHIAKMNLERKLSELPKHVGKSGLQSLNRQKKVVESVGKGSMKALKKGSKKTAQYEKDVATKKRPGESRLQYTERRMKER